MKSRIFYIAAFFILLAIGIFLIFSGKNISDIVGHNMAVEKITEILLIFMLLRYWIGPEFISKMSEKK